MACSRFDGFAAGQACACAWVAALMAAGLIDGPIPVQSRRRRSATPGAFLYRRPVRYISPQPSQLRYPPGLRPFDLVRPAVAFIRPLPCAWSGDSPGPEGLRALAAGSPYDASASAWRRTAPHKGEQGQERRRGSRRAEMIPSQISRYERATRAGGKNSPTPRPGLPRNSSALNTRPRPSPSRSPRRAGSPPAVPRGPDQSRSRGGPRSRRTGSRDRLRPRCATAGRSCPAEDWRTAHQPAARPETAAAAAAAAPSPARCRSPEHLAVGFGTLWHLYSMIGAI